MKKYFRIHEYSSNEKAIIDIYNLNGGASIWWEHLMQVKGIEERRMNLKGFLKGINLERQGFPHLMEKVRQIKKQKHRFLG